MRICRKMGWSLTYKWAKLPPLEQEAWLNHERNRLKKIAEFKEKLIEAKALDGSALAIIRMFADLL